MFSDIHLINLRIMAEVLIAIHMLARFLPHKEHFILRIAISSAVCILFAWLFPVPPFAAHHYVGWGLLMYGSFFAVAAGSIACCYQETFLPVLCCTITGYTIHQIASALNGVLTLISKMTGFLITEGIAWFLSIVLTFIPAYLTLSKEIRKSDQIRIDNKKLPFLSVVVLLVDIVIGLYLLELQKTYDAPGYEMMIQLLNMLACIFVLNMQMSLIANRNLKTELEIVSNMLQKEKRQYENSRHNIAIINQKCHDLKHQLRTLRHQSGEVDRSVLKEIEQAVDIYDTSTQTGNAALDVILTEKKLLCESKGITLTCIADGSGLEHVSPPDIYALFGNILDNAIEAVSQLHDTDARGISLSVRCIAGMTVIHAENRYQGLLTLQDGLPPTQKTDTAYHGFGMKSIRMIAEKYGGQAVVSLKDQIFSLNVTLMLP